MLFLAHKTAACCSLNHENAAEKQAKISHCAPQLAAIGFLSHLGAPSLCREEKTKRYHADPVAMKASHQSYLDREMKSFPLQPQDGSTCV